MEAIAEQVKVLTGLLVFIIIYWLITYYILLIETNKRKTADKFIYIHSNDENKYQMQDYEDFKKYWKQ